VFRITFDQRSLERLSNQLPTQVTQRLPRPVNFERECLIIAYLGEMPAGEYGVHVTEVENRGTSVNVTLQTVSPAPGQLTTQALTYPAEIILLPKKDFPTGVLAFSFRTLDGGVVAMQQVINGDLDDYRLHYIRTGDTLWSIARRVGTSVDKLLLQNPGIVPDNLIIGEPVVIAHKPATATQYVVKPGDTLWRVARDHNLSLDQIYTLNPGVRAEYLCIGQRIVVPPRNVKPLKQLLACTQTDTKNRMGHAGRFMTHPLSSGKPIPVV